MLKKFSTNTAKRRERLHLCYRHWCYMLLRLHCCSQSYREFTVLYRTVDIKKMDGTSAILLILTAILMLMVPISKTFGFKQL